MIFFAALRFLNNDGITCQAGRMRSVNHVDRAEVFSLEDNMSLIEKV